MLQQARPKKSQLLTSVAWRPLPGSQEIAIDTRCHHTLYTGTRGPGKTDAQLMFFRKFVGMGYGSFWRGVIFDREYKNLDDLVLKSKRWFKAFGDGAEFKESKADYKWVWPTGEELLFRVVKTDADYWKFHGQEFPFIGWNELAKYPTSKLYDDLMSCNRSSYTPAKDGFIGGLQPKNHNGGPPLDGEIVSPVDQDGNRPGPIPLRVFSTTNPYGPGHNWVKHRFIDPAPYGTVVRKTINVFNPQTQERLDVTKTQIAIFGSYRENIYLSPEYVAELESVRDPNKRKAWLEGDWDIVAGGALDDVWDKIVHVLPRFKIPPGWSIDRALDWGSSHPFYVGWFAEANGEEAMIPDGKDDEGKPKFRIFCPPSGTIVLLSEYYGSREIGTNEGVKWSAGKVADTIIEREVELMRDNWIPTQPWPGPADNQIRDVRESDVDTIEKKMSDKGVRWEASDKSPGSRKNGLQLIRDRLEAATLKEGPALYFMEHCRATISTLPTLPRDEEKIDDVDTTAEDHPYDAVRYRVLKGNNRYARSIPLSFPH